MRRSGIFNILDYGALGNGEAKDTRAIQDAIDVCHESGGGIVLFPAGNYVCATVILKSNVCISLQQGANILASLDLEEFPSLKSKYPSYTGSLETYKSLFYAEDAYNIAITGNGCIDGRVQELEIEYAFPSFSVRPRLIHLRHCKRVRVRDISLINSSSWVQHYKWCEDLLIDGITVDSIDNPDIEKPRFYCHPGLNQDGLDIDSCRNVMVSNCNVISGDDGICLKSRAEEPCENVVISNCIVRCNASGIKLGTESNGGFRNITIQNCVVYDTRIGGLEVLEVDGGGCENIIISNVTMNNIKGAAIFIRLGDRSRPLSPEQPVLAPGKLERVIINNIIATHVGGCCDDSERISRIGCSITGIPGHPVKNISIKNVKIMFIGGGSSKTCLEQVPENEKEYPSPTLFGGDLPAYGFYCRHVEGLELEGLDLQLMTDDDRPAIVLDETVSRSKLLNI